MSGERSRNGAATANGNGTSKPFTVILGTSLKVFDITLGKNRERDTTIGRGTHKVKCVANPYGGNGLAPWWVLSGNPNIGMSAEAWQTQGNAIVLHG